MKNHAFILVGLGLLSIGIPAYSIERPSEGRNGAQPRTPVVEPLKLDALSPAPSPAADAGRRDPRVNARARTAKRGLLLGIQPGSVPPALKAQLKLDGFSGVLVEGVVKGSPAQKAGIMKYDVITKVGDKPISTPRNIQEALIDAQPGDKVPVELMRASKAETVELVLDEALVKPFKEGEAQDLFGPKDHIDKAIRAGKVPMPPDMLPDDELNDLYDMASRMLSFAERAQSSPLNRQFSDRMRRMTEQMHRRAAGLQVESLPMQGGNYSKSSVMLYDNQGVIELKSDSEAGTRLTVKDRSGKVIFDGPYSSDEDKAKVPADIKERVEAVCVNIKNR